MVVSVEQGEFYYNLFTIVENTNFPSFRVSGEGHDKN